jgi:carbon storage regulator
MATDSYVPGSGASRSHLERGTLVLSRQRDQGVMIGDDIEVFVAAIRGDKVRLGFRAPKSISVHRTEVYDAIRRDQQALAKQSEVA